MIIIKPLYGFEEISFPLNAAYLRTVYFRISVKIDFFKCF